MIRKALKKTTKSEKLQAFIKKSKISPEFLKANRKMISRGVVLGLFIAFIPMPMQMAAVLLFMPIFRFNVPLAIAMVWITNPFTMPPIYVIEYYTGSFFLGTHVQEVEMTLEWFSDNIDDIFIPLYTGALFYSITVSTAAYYLVNYFWEKSVHKDKKKHRHNR
ncbi:DUF2062 domain-containing protein [Sulfurimonas sp. SAG-AH-194-L11]|nr:DUF2062 domain-containing protein [Sulfurimonas sp. SAG-AH-194-L11]MDF1877552.1 DUF2062 domain-containing protein [Sulfurimonas sp. SAG-AH-194-L11]